MITEKIYLRIEGNFPRSELSQRFLGPDNLNLKYIQNQTGCIISLRGEDSGFVENTIGRELDQLHFLVTYRNSQEKSEAQPLIFNLIETVQSDLEDVYGKHVICYRPIINDKTGKLSTTKQKPSSLHYNKPDRRNRISPESASKGGKYKLGSRYVAADRKNVKEIPPLMRPDMDASPIKRNSMNFRRSLSFDRNTENIRITRRVKPTLSSTKGMLLSMGTNEDYMDKIAKDITRNILNDLHRNESSFEEGGNSRDIKIDRYRNRSLSRLDNKELKSSSYRQSSPIADDVRPWKMALRKNENNAFDKRSFANEAYSSFPHRNTIQSRSPNSDRSRIDQFGDYGRRRDSDSEDLRPTIKTTSTRNPDFHRPEPTDDSFRRTLSKRSRILTRSPTTTFKQPSPDPTYSRNNSGYPLKRSSRSPPYASIKSHLKASPYEFVSKKPLTSQSLSYESSIMSTSAAKSPPIRSTRLRSSRGRTPPIYQVLRRSIDRAISRRSMSENRKILIKSREISNVHDKSAIQPGRTVSRRDSPPIDDRTIIRRDFKSYIKDEPRIIKITDNKLSAVYRRDDVRNKKSPTRNKSYVESANPIAYIDLDDDEEEMQINNVDRKRKFDEHKRTTTNNKISKRSSEMNDDSVLKMKSSTKKEHHRHHRHRPFDDNDVYEKDESGHRGDKMESPERRYHEDVKFQRRHRDDKNRNDDRKLYAPSTIDMSNVKRRQRDAELLFDVYVNDKYKSDDQDDGAKRAAASKRRGLSGRTSPQDVMKKRKYVDDEKTTDTGVKRSRDFINEHGKHPTTVDVDYSSYEKNLHNIMESLQMKSSICNASIINTDKYQDTTTSLVDYDRRTTRNVAENTYPRITANSYLNYPTNSSYQEHSTSATTFGHSAAAYQHADLLRTFDGSNSSRNSFHDTHMHFQPQQQQNVNNVQWQQNYGVRQREPYGDPMPIVDEGLPNTHSRVYLYR